MLVVALNFVEGEVEFWVCCGSLGISIVFARDMGNLIGQHLCFEKSKHTRGIWWKVKPYLRKHNIKFYLRF
jgi:hypothetical protein